MNSEWKRLMEQEVIFDSKTLQRCHDQTVARIAKVKTLDGFVETGMITLEEAACKANMSVERFQGIVSGKWQ